MAIKEKRISDMRKQEILGRMKAISKHLKDEYHAERVILFGSYTKGETTKDSDVDILVITSTEERFFKRMATVLERVRDLYEGLALSPIVLKPEEVAKRLRD